MSMLSDLLRIRSLIENPKHWGQGPCGYRPGRICFAQAIRRAIHATCSADCADVLAVLVPQPMLYFQRERAIIRFNDAPDTTHEMVLAFLDCAIARQRVINGLFEAFTPAAIAWPPSLNSRSPSPLPVPPLLDSVI